MGIEPDRSFLRSQEHIDRDHAGQRRERMPDVLCAFGTVHAGHGNIKGLDFGHVLFPMEDIFC